MRRSVELVAEAVESALEKQGLRLTLGGEPTFIPEHPEGGEWNHDAMGPQKLGYARKLAARLLREGYPGGLVMQVFGKQYPDEPLPRWVVLLLHRDDDVPLWNHPEMLLLDGAKGSNTAANARELTAALAAELGLTNFVLPCIEKDEPAWPPRGWVLPLDRVDDDWVSDAWPYTHDEPVVLTPGLSPLGLRLPLGELGDRNLRRALTVEVTGGALHVFIPPLELDAFAALVRVIERAALARGVSDLVLCGYRPAAVPDIMTLGLAADPGVLEVNLPPSSSWASYDRVLCEITQAAAAEGLVTTRLHLNGQVQGTGGGAHVLFGGPSVDDNPFFERPALLSSIIRYWQRHPALSYFFSGQYVGPGSQAPRADETLMTKLYELETACLGADVADSTADRGFLDRTFRNLLTDSAGNMHLAEISVDKLWNYDSPTGLQGLIELRAFQTMPRVEDQSICALLVRAVVAMLAASPCVGPFVRHGPALHDRYMLPAGLWEDLAEVCADLRAAGLPFELDWLRPIRDVRFPVLGRLELEGGQVLVRQALEPWPLMAETGSGGPTSRVVDNSTDRIELSLSDSALADVGTITAGGVALRFSELGGSLVAGVRYKAASGWPALHPHVPVQSPLRIEALSGDDVVLASARYFFWNPDGPRYEGRPRDFQEARRRREARFKPDAKRVGHRERPGTPAYFEESFHTLDLRRQPGSK